MLVNGVDGRGMSSQRKQNSQADEEQRALETDGSACPELL